jgi:hypothetical protein
MIARTAWNGATGRILGPVASFASKQDFWNNACNALSTRIQLAMGTETGPVGSAVGRTRGSIRSRVEALRNSGMAHLCRSVAHVPLSWAELYTGASMLALWPRSPLRVSKPLASAACAIIQSYTLLTGAEVTVRACIAALRSS